MVQGYRVNQPFIWENGWVTQSCLCAAKFLDQINDVNWFHTIWCDLDVIWYDLRCLDFLMSECKSKCFSRFYSSHKSAGISSKRLKALAWIWFFIIGMFEQLPKKPAKKKGYSMHSAHFLGCFQHGNLKKSQAEKIPNNLKTSSEFGNISNPNPRFQAKRRNSWKGTSTTSRSLENEPLDTTQIWI